MLSKRTDTVRGLRVWLALALTAAGASVPLSAAPEAGMAPTPQREALGVLGPKPFIAYFKPTPIVTPLSKTAWGAISVGARDTGNGLEDTELKQWNYWDGPILEGPDG